MLGLKFHWWVLIGIVVGATAGTVINRSHLDDARQAVLGDSYTAADVQLHGKELNDELVKRVKGTFIGGAMNGLARIFMNLLKMIVIPLVFFSLVMGIVGMGGAKRLGRIGLRTAVWYISTSLMAIIVGLVAVNVIGPGVGSDLLIPTEARSSHPPGSFWDVLVTMVPANIVRAAADFDMFGIIVFSILFGIFLVTIDAEKRAGMTSFIEGGSDVMMRMTEFVISLAPVGIMCLVGFTVATSGPGIFISLLSYVLTVILALAFHFLVTLPVLFWFITKRKPFVYMKAMSPALVTAFSTASSAGTLAVTMKEAEEGAGVSKRVTSFVLPLGATVNMDGTALYECVTVIFIAQVHAATHPDFAALGLGAQLLIVFLALSVSIGAAAVPHAGLIMMVIILNAVGLPLEYTALVWAVDRVLDMLRTMTNVWSDSCGAAVIGHLEGEIDESVLFGLR